MTAKEIHSKLVEKIDEVCLHLLPGGKRSGSEWESGSTSGDSGKSLKVRMTGDKAGIWSDFAEGSKGDLIDLWRTCRSLSFGEAMKEIRQWLGLPEDDRQFQKSGKTYKRPGEPSGKLVYGKAMEYLKGRGLTPETLREAGIRSTDTEIIFPYIDPSGALILEKTLKIERKNGKKEIFLTGDAEPVLFGWNFLYPDARSVTICEGEIDCLTLFQLGIPTLSVPFGGGSGAKHSWVEREYERLSVFDEIFLCFDNDEAGQKAMSDLVPRLGRDRCRVVILPKKDPSECLMSGIDMMPYFQAARTCDPEGLHPSSDYTQAAMDILLNRNARDSGFPLPWCDRIRFRPSELTIWNGINGHGKTTALNHLSIALLSAGHRILYCSHEMSPERLKVQMIRQACGDGIFSDERSKRLDIRLFEGLLIYIGKKDRNEAIRYAVRRYGITHVIIDNLTRLSKMDDYSGQQEIVQGLSDLKDDLGIHIHLVTHARKGESESLRPDKFDVRGAGPITDIADNVLTLHRNKEKSDLLSKTDLELHKLRKLRGLVLEDRDATLYVQKQRVDGWEGSIPLWFDLLSHQFGSSFNFSPVAYDRGGEIPF